MTPEARAVFAHRDTAPRDTSAPGVERAQLLDPRDTAGRSVAEDIAVAPGTIVEIGDAATLRYVFVTIGEWALALGADTRTCRTDDLIQVPAETRCSATLLGTTPGRLLLVTLPTPA